MSKIQYIQQIIGIPLPYINKINTVIFKYLWGGIDKIKRKTITNNTYKGGLSLTDINISICNITHTKIKENN